MIVAVLSDDLLFSSRLMAIAENSGARTHRYPTPRELPPAGETDLLLVDWAARNDDWEEAIVGWRDASPVDLRPRVVLYGPHTDLEAHQAARRAGLGPMWARSKALAQLPTLLSGLLSAR